MKRLRFPDTLVLIFGIIVLAQLLTYVLPPGEFEREGRRVVPGSFEYLESSPMMEGGFTGFLSSLPTFLTAIPRGMEAAAGIIFLIFVFGGVIGMVKATLKENEECRKSLSASLMDKLVGRLLI